MNDKRKTAFAAGAAILVVAAVSVGTLAALHRGPWATAATAEPAVDLGPVIAEVNGHPIYLADAESRIDGIATVHGKISDVLGENWQQVVFQSLVDDQLLGQEAERRGIAVTQEDLQSWEAEIQATIGPDQSVDQWLTSQGMTRSEMDRTIARQIIGTRVYAAVTENVEVSTTQLRDYYEAHLADYTAPDGSATPFRDVRDAIRTQVAKDQESAAYATWLAQQRDVATVNVVIDGWWKELS